MYDVESAGERGATPVTVAVRPAATAGWSGWSRSAVTAGSAGSRVLVADEDLDVFEDHIIRGID